VQVTTHSLGRRQERISECLSNFGPAEFIHAGDQNDSLAASAAASQAALLRELPPQQAERVSTSQPVMRRLGYHSGIVTRKSAS
jgi:hypothetical protein